MLADEIKGCNGKRAEEYARQLREVLLGAVRENGGHLSSNLGVVELTVALYSVFDFPKDKLIFDVGHQSYAHKLITGRTLDTLRKRAA